MDGRRANLLTLKCNSFGLPVWMLIQDLNTVINKKSDLSPIWLVEFNGKKCEMMEMGKTSRRPILHYFMGKKKRLESNHYLNSQQLTAYSLEKTQRRGILWIQSGSLNTNCLLGACGANSCFISCPGFS